MGVGSRPGTQPHAFSVQIHGGGELSRAEVRARLPKRAAILITGPGITDAVRAAALRPLLER
jgi:hypothetical protein